MNRCVSLGVACGLVSLWLAPLPIEAQTGAAVPGVTRTYYVAADEVVWDYAPGQMDHAMGEAIDARAQVFLEKGEDRLGKVYLKALYREYTNGDFTTLKPRPPSWEHLGILGPVLRGEVGDTLTVVSAVISRAACTRITPSSPGRRLPSRPRIADG